ncbi:MAG: hypothetical protein ACPF9F_02690 [Acholeplasmataceae bacterium]
MKKIIWGLLFVLGISFLAFGLIRFNSSAAEAELYMDLLLDVDDQDYKTPFGVDRHGGYRQPLAFISLGETIKEDILEKAALYGIEPARYVLAITVATYSDAYDFETVIQTIQDADEVTLKAYVNELNAFLDDNAEAIKATLDEIKETYAPQIQAIRETYMDDIKTLIDAIKNTTDEIELAVLNEDLEALKAEIASEVAVIQAAFVQDLEDNNIAIEGLYGMFMRQMENRFDMKMAMLERRFPRLYQRVKNHFNKD